MFTRPFPSSNTQSTSGNTIIDQLISSSKSAIQPIQNKVAQFTREFPKLSFMDKLINATKQALPKTQLPTQPKPFFQNAPMSNMELQQPRAPFIGRDTSKDELKMLEKAKFPQGIFSDKRIQLGPAAEERYRQLKDEQLLSMVMAFTGGMKDVSKGVTPTKFTKPLAREARKYKNAEGFVNDYGPTTREVSPGKPVSGALGEFTSERKIKVKTKGLSKREIKELIGHEQRHSVTDKVMGYFLKRDEKGFFKELSRVKKIVKNMPMVVGVKTEGEIDAQILEQFVYNNQQFKKELPELHKYLTDYFNLRKEARSIPNLTDFYTQATGGVKK